LLLRKEKRENHIFIDTLRNQYAATTVAPYAVRLKPKAPVATPLYWNELYNSELTAQTYTINTVLERLAVAGDPWQDFKKSRFC
jgi:bifunctional non-homologous end joining protein LigD